MEYTMYVPTMLHIHILTYTNAQTAIVANTAHCKVGMGNSTS